MPVTQMFLPPTYGLSQAPVFDMGLVIGAAGATTTQTSPDVNTLNFKGITVILDVSAIGTANLTVQVQGKDFSNSGNYFTILASSGITANGTTAHTVYPGITAATAPNGSTAVSIILPVWLRIRVVAGNANAATYTVGAVLTT
jgi:hypothetical protein